MRNQINHIICSRCSRNDKSLFSLTNLQTLSAARGGHEDVVRVHSAEDQRGAIPLLAAEPAANRTLRVVSLQAAHADAGQELRAAFHFHLRTK